MSPGGKWGKRIPSPAPLEEAHLSPGRGRPEAVASQRRDLPVQAEPLPRHANAAPQQIREEALASGQIVRDTMDEAWGKERKPADAPDAADATPGDPGVDPAGPAASEPVDQALATVPYDPEAT